MLGLNPQNLSQKYHNLKQLKPKISQYATSWENRMVKTGHTIERTLKFERKNKKDFM
jgi:hypothetical protein